MDCSRLKHPTRQNLRLHHFLLCLLAVTVFCSGQQPAKSPSATPAAAVLLNPADDATQKLRHGDYVEAVATAQKAIDDSYPSESLLRVKTEALMAQGKYNEAYSTLREATINDRSSIRLLLLLHQSCLYTGKTEEAQQALTEIKAILVRLAYRQQNSQTPLVPALLADAGEGALLQNLDPTQPKLDPKQLLQQFFTPGEQSTPPGA